jgi:S1-C subfamily serine protease
MRVEPSVVVLGGGDYELVVPSEAPRPAKKAAPDGAPKAEPTAVAAEPEAGGRPGLGFMPDYEAGVDGVQVGQLTPGGAAEKAGILEGDVIVRLGDEDVADLHEYMGTLDGLRVGSTVDVVVIRDGERKTLPVKVGARGH